MSTEDTDIASRKLDSEGWRRQSAAQEGSGRVGRKNLFLNVDEKASGPEMFKDMWHSLISVLNMETEAQEVKKLVQVHLAH